MNGRPRLQGCADEMHELAAKVAAEFGRERLDANKACLIERLRHLTERLDYEVSIEDYRASLRTADPYGRRSQRTRDDLEGAYGVALPPLPERVQALGDGGEE